MWYLKIFIILCLSKYFIEADIKCTKESSIICYFSNLAISSTESFVIIKDTQAAGSFVIISNGQMPIMPNTIFANNPMITSISIGNMSLQQITPENFQKGGNLKTILIMYGEVKTLMNGTFKTCENLQQLQVTDHQISTIESNAFQGLKNLNSLTVTNNRLTSLHPLTFQPLSSLTILLMKGNSITSLDSNLFIKNPALMAISFNNNQLTELPSDLFKNQNFKSGSIEFTNNQLTTAQSYGSYIVDMSFNQLKNFHLSSGEDRVTIHDNFIRKIFCPNTSVTVTKLYAANNALSNFLCIRDMTNLTDLDVSDNKLLVKPTQKTFTKLTNLKSLVMCNMTKFSTIPAKAFAPTKNTLSMLRVDRLSSYKTVKQLLPKLSLLGLNTLNMNCTFFQHMRDLLHNQSITMNYCTISDNRRCI